MLPELVREAAEQVPSLQESTATSPRSPHILTSWLVQPSSSRTIIAGTGWDHTTFGAKARHCISHCSFVSQQSKRVKRFSLRVSAININGVSSPDLFTDHKPLTFALKSTSDKINPRELNQLDFISQFTSDIFHIDRSGKEVADALSRPSIARLQLSPGIDFADMAGEQRRVGSPCDDDVSRLQLQELPLTTGNGTILCDAYTPSCRQFVPPSLCRKVFSSLNNLSHPGSRAADKLVSDHFG
ncbi:unnamed protein product [Schistocephalus solidus]|uniref:Uncharacterized protein n=1 Tax=Schistocephalus solidus TaxID=70667 RepID=A0A183SWD3_SCHSO|nr:unnamed protein product [Schistocephalus solidus]